MTLGIIGKKIGMTRIFDEKGGVIPVTIIQAGPCPVLQVKRAATDGYSAVQLGFDRIPERKVNKPAAGHFAKSKSEPVRVIREFRVEAPDGYEEGGFVDAGIFEAGEKVDVSGISKGRGFASAIKRHHITRGPETHGSMYHRRVGSMGASSDPSRVFKGKKLAGHMGNCRATTQNVKVVRVDKTNNILVLRGSVPGHNNGYVTIAKSRKAEIKKARAKK